MKVADELKVALVTAVCIIGSAVIFKNVLHVRADFMVSFGPAYLFIVYLITRGRGGKCRYDKPLYWSMGIILVTLAVIILYAL
jgi:hypothetical protein